MRRPNVSAGPALAVRSARPAPLDPYPTRSSSSSRERVTSVVFLSRTSSRRLPPRSPSSPPLPRLPSSSLITVLAGRLSRPPWSPVVLGGRPLHRLRPHGNSPSLRLQLPWPPLQLRSRRPELTGVLTGVLAGAHPPLANKKDRAPREMLSAATYDEKSYN